MMIERYINDYVSATQAPCRQDIYFHTASALHAAALSPAWADDEYQALEFLSKRAEISRCLYEGYQESGTRASTTRLPSELQVLTLVLLFKDFRRLSSTPCVTEAVKRLNGVLKLLDTLTAENIALQPALVSLIKAEGEQFLTTLQHADSSPSETVSHTIKPVASRTLSLTVLFWEGPIARAYLATLKSMGLTPERIIHLVSKTDLVTRKPIGRFLPGGLRLAYAQSRQKNSIHYWSTALRKTERSLYHSIRTTVEAKLDFLEDTLDNAQALTDLSEYSPIVETLMIESLADSALHTRLLALSPTQILFTGGGIVPTKLLEIPTLKFIHIHPGHLPEVRGADCVLWSQLMKGRTSATCFYMAPGIDDGDVILASYLPAMAPPLNIAQLDVKALYRATYAFFDPWVRAFVLRQAIVATEGFTHVNASPQVEHTSITYHFMHPTIQNVAFSRLFAAA